MSGAEEADAEERAFVATMPADQRPHYELNDGTCVTCGQPWICQRGLATDVGMVATGADLR